jgi:murein L,D-transpeptidase YafK
MAFLRVLLLITLALGLAACGGTKFKTYNGPTVTQVQVHKADRKMYLFHNEKLLKSYDIGLGGNPIGHKQFEGDLKTPEGTYYISHRNPKSRYHLSLGISYPNESAGGDIMIHGAAPYATTNNDWTAGCIAVSDKEIEKIYAMVNPGTPIIILP